MVTFFSMIKALFFDIDGTLVSFKTHKIPDSTVRAIKRAKDMGLQIYISTGRPFSLINNLHEISDWIDGFITVNGAYCFIGKQVIFCSPIPRDDVSMVIKMSDEMGFACMVVGEQEVVMYHSNEKVDVIFKQMLNVRQMRESNDIDTILSQPVLQLTPVISESEERQIMTLLAHSVSSRWYPDFADITARDTNKGRGLEAVMAYKGLSREETMAFGDGGNDVPIIKAAGIGVAMGNANESLKAVADYVTATVDDDGVEKALDYWIFKTDGKR